MATPKYEQLKQSIRQNIRDGIWKPGEKIPFEKTLCEQFGVSEITVKKAKRDLIAEGVLESLPGRRGTFVRQSNNISSTDLIGVAIDGAKDPFFADMLHGIEDKLWEYRLHPILCSVYFDIEKVEAYFQSLLQRDVAGVIFAPLKGPGYVDNNKKIIAMLTERQIPVVLLDRYIPDLLVNSVVSDNRQGSKELTKRLIEKGHTRILVLTGVECSSINDRIRGYLDALEEAGLEQDRRLIIRVDDVLFQMQQHYGEELARVQGLVEQAEDFAACYTMSSVILQEAIQVLFPKGKNLGRKIEIVTYDNNIQELMAITDHVTFVKQPAYKMGWEAAKLLIDTINNPDQRVVQITLKAEIIEKVIG